MSKAKSTGVDIDAILAGNMRKRPGTQCDTCTAIATMPANWQAKIAQVFADKTNHSIANIVDIFRALGHDIGKTSIERHRNRGCLGSRGLA